MSNIIAPLDGSPYNERTIRTIRSIALASRGTIELLYVLTPGHKNDRLPSRAAAERYLSGITPGLSDICQVYTRVVEGRPAGQILVRIEEVDDPLVVLNIGAFGRRGRFSGSRVTQEVIRRSSAPVVAIQPGGMVPSGRLERLLVPLDGSTLAESILPLTIDLATASRTTVELVWVEDLEHISRVYGFDSDVADGGASIVGQRPEQLNQAAQRYLAEQARLLASHGIEASWEILHGLVAPAINRRAWVQSSDLILMATHGRSRLGILALGSITQEVLSQSKSPVLILPPLARERLAWVRPAIASLAA